ncbi:MAG: ADP-glyceromanno-heptose 6-epimerase [Chlamydiae bacterium RIFCSPHIGHO2_12_FULL_49_9]|nr:MAG: ADP-glyceromanno-heptose 6-epimerase [Chlamydiae bacterium RIFCSPHIGHO2_12_FULL_49_9]
MEILITGAAGMIGSGVVRHLNDLGFDHLILVDDLKSGDKWKNLVGKQFKEIISKHKIFEWLEERGGEVDAIIHLGACSSTVETDADYLLENNYRFTIRLASWALEANKRFIYASSAATYGSGSLGFSDDEASLESLRPLNMYGYSKHLVDLWMKREGVLGRVVGLKYFNVFGPNEYHKGQMASMIFKMKEKVETEGVIKLYKSNDPKRYSDGGQMRDFIYLKDAVRMTCGFLDQPKIGGIFNIGQGRATTWNELGAALFKAMQKEPNIHYIDMPQEMSRQYQNYTCADMGKLCRIFQTKWMSIETSVADYMGFLKTGARW